MSAYDEHFGKIGTFLENVRQQGRSVNEIYCPLTIDGLLAGMPVRVGDGANPGIILRSDMYAELGNPTTASAAFIIWTENSSLVTDGRIAVVGPDVPELDGASVPFGQVLMLSGEKLNVESEERIEEYQHISDTLQGYMVRSSSRSIWGRISRDAVAKGFTMETLGRALMISMKLNVPGIDAVEVVFVTSGKDDVNRIGRIAAEVDEIRKGIIKGLWKGRGYDLDCDLDCSSCKSKATCDDIRDMIRSRKERGEVGIGEGED